MPSDDPQDLNPMAGPDDAGFTTGGAMERRRRRRMALLVALAILLAALSYATFYYVMNRRLPIPQVIAGTEVFMPPGFLYAFSGTGPTAMNRPTGIGIIGNLVYVTDDALRNVRVYTRDGAFQFDFGAIKDGTKTKMGAPVHIATSPAGEVWVTDRLQEAVYIFDGQGEFLRKFVPDGDPKFVWSPLAIAIGPDGNVYVTDVRANDLQRVLVFKPDGTLVTEWGRTQQIEAAGEAPGGFLFPNGIAVKALDGAASLVFVADANNRRVQAFKPDGAFVRIINNSGTPRGIALDQKGRLYVVDALSHRVDVYTDTGGRLTTFGENGTGPGQFNFPNDVAVDDAGRILIVDRENNQVQVWGYAVAEIPGITKVSPNQWWLCLLPFLLLLIPVFMRRRRFVVTPDFVEGMIVAGLVEKMVEKRWRWIMTEADAEAYQGRFAETVNLGELLHGEPYSDTEAGMIRNRFGVTIARAGLLAMAKHYKVLCTEDVELARYAARLGVDVYDRAAWLAAFDKKRPAPAKR